MAPNVPELEGYHSKVKTMRSFLPVYLLLITNSKPTWEA